MTYLAVNTFLTPVAECNRSGLKLTSRVLLARPASEFVVVIAVTPVISHGRLYYNNPKIFLKDLIEQDLRDHAIATSLPIERQLARLGRPDLEKILPLSKNDEGEEECYQLLQRDERWKLLKDLVKGPESELLLDPSYRVKLIRDHAKNLQTPERGQEILERDISRFLNQYLACGSDERGLIGFSSRCGAPGRPRAGVRSRRQEVGSQNDSDKRAPLGRPRNAPADRKDLKQTMILSFEDIEIIQYCYASWVKPNESKGKAFRRMLIEYFSRTEVLSDRTVRKVPFDADKTPSLVQFCTHGPVGAHSKASYKQLLPGVFLKQHRALFGYAAGDASMLGAVGAIDSTSGDAELVKRHNRLQRIGTPTQTSVVDLVTTYIPGFYFGIDEPSSTTVKLALLHGASDKTEWLAYLDLLGEQDPSDWLRIQFASIQGDNTDARSKEIFLALGATDTGGRYIAVRRSDMNSAVESSHHGLHVRGDHNLVGTNYGRRAARGEATATENARHTTWSAMRAAARAVHQWNTGPCDVPQSMAMIEAGIPQTRLAMARFLQEQRMVAESLGREDDTRMALMPKIRGTFTPRGVLLHAPDSGLKKVYIRNVQYVSDDSAEIIGLCEASRAPKRLAALFESEFHFDPSRPGSIFWCSPRTGTLIRLNARTPISGLLEEGTLVDIVILSDDMAAAEIVKADAKTRSLGSLEAMHRESNALAQDEYQAALDAAESPLTKAAMKANKLENRANEKNESIFGTPLANPSDSPVVGVDEPQKDCVPPAGEKPGAAEAVTPAETDCTHDKEPLQAVCAPARQDATPEINDAIRKFLEQDQYDAE